jgi:hypothetical protein
MKKLLFIAIALFAMTFASCNGRVTPVSNPNDSVVDSTDSVNTDSIVAADSTVNL